MACSTSTRATRMIVLGALATATLAVGGCVSQQKYQRLYDAYDQAKAQLASQEEQLASLQSQIKTLEAQLADKDKLLAAQGGGVSALMAERDALKARLAKLQDQYNKLLALANSAPKLPASVNNALEQLAQQYPDLLQYNKALGLVRFKSDLTFALGSTEVRQEARQALAKFAQILDMSAIADNELRIVGNTDDVPIRRNRASVMNPTNWYLSTNRAISVMYVLKHYGVLPRRMQVAGWGKTHPIAPNAPRHRGNAMNRRVDIYILPVKLKYNPYVPASDQPAATGNNTGIVPANGQTIPVPSGDSN